jgi:HAD superfamily hydrolase (TIGR01549 family)
MIDGARIDGAGALIFDFDGTLYDSKKFALRLIAAKPWDIFLIGAERRVRAYCAGRDFASPDAYFAAFFEELSRHTHRSAASMRTWYFEDYIPRMVGVLEKHYRCRPRTAELFNSLACGDNFRNKKIPFAVYSDYPATLERLRAIGIEGSSAVCYGPEDFGAQKPSPRPFLSIAAALGCAAQDVLVVGDRYATDGAGAAAAGMRYINIDDGAAWGEFCEEILINHRANEE